MLYGLAEAIFAYIDELSAESVEGYAAEQSAREGAREVRRGRLLAALAQDPALEAAELERLAGEADWPLPEAVAALLCAPGGGVSHRPAPARGRSCRQRSRVWAA